MPPATPATVVRASNGKLPAGLTAIFVAAKPMRMFHVGFVNVGVSGPQDVVLYLEHSGRSVLARGTLTDPGWRMQALDGEFPLAIGDRLLAETANPNTVDYVVAGIEQL